MKVIGITGTFSAGAGTAAQILGELLGAPVASYSDKLREVILQRGFEITRERLQSTANELRPKDPPIISRLVLEDFEKKKGKKLFVAEKLRSMGDYTGFKKKLGGNFILLAIDAPLQVRYARALKRRREGEESLSFEEFVASEEKENKGNALEGEMNISALMRIADYSIVNNGSEKELRVKLEEFARKFGLLDLRQ